MLAALSDSTPDLVLAAGFLLVLASLAWVLFRGVKHIKLNVGNIQAELQPNGGSTIRDSLDRLETKVDGHFGDLFQKVDEHTRILNEHSKRLDLLEKPKKAPVKRKKAT